MSLAPGKQNYPMDHFPMENSPGSEHHSEVNKIQRMIYDQLFPTPNPHPNHTPIVGNEMIQVRWGFFLVHVAVVIRFFSHNLFCLSPF